MAKMKLMATAIHESAHAVACVLLGGRLKSVTIVETSESCGMTYVTPTDCPKSKAKAEKWLLTQCLIWLSGPAAERRFRGRWNHQGARGDYQLVRWIAEDCHEGEREQDRFLEYYKQLAVRWIENDDVWDLIMDVAEELLVKKTMNARQVKRLCRIASPAPRAIAS